ncbi:MAG TPA: hypothetical protein P5205_12085 [Candidatus Paceibacterota bacterium]|nr:hypothetical protein [Verrucomicrobiota bacterium]HSA11099.1 hypothetical protein [Candidatus Paceibacterota bacterium]
MKHTVLLKIGFSVVLCTQCATAQRSVFHDDFESGTLNNWTATTGGPMTIAVGPNADPPGGIYSAYADSQGDRMHHNLLEDNGGPEVSGASWFTAYIYDTGFSNSRWHVQALSYSGTGLPNGGTTPDGSLTQLLAIGKYTTVTLPGDVYDATKYQGRVTFGSANGYFNLSAPGAPDRSVGWHKFTIQRLADETTINFYVDDVLGRTITGATAGSWDTITMGYGAGTFREDVWYDGISVTVPEPSATLLCALGGCLVALRQARRRVA